MSLPDASSLGRWLCSGKEERLLVRSLRPQVQGGKMKEGRSVGLAHRRPAKRRKRRWELCLATEDQLRDLCPFERQTASSEVLGGEQPQAAGSTALWPQAALKWW